jgi:hypothetical protein
LSDQNTTNCIAYVLFIDAAKDADDEKCKAAVDCTSEVYRSAAYDPDD